MSLPGFETFEHVRTEKSGGGLLTAIHSDLNPFLVYDDAEIELVVVQIEIENISIRVFNAYGPQEDDDSTKKDLFWQTIETEIVSARQEGCLILLELDANAKIGSEYLPGDPNPLSENGRTLLGLVSRQGMHIGNLDHKCTGIITRERVLHNKTEKSVLDYLIYCERMKEYLEEINIDESREMALRHSTKNKQNVYTKSDHNIIIGKFNLKVARREARLRVEFFNFKAADDRQKFFQVTSTSNNLSSCFTHQPTNFENSCTSFFKQLDKTFHKCFTKVRVKEGGCRRVGDKVIQAIMQAQAETKRLAKISSCTVSQLLILRFEQKLDEFLKYYQHKVNAQFIKDHLNLLQDDDKLNINGFWKLKNRLFSSPRTPPIVKCDTSGNLITSNNALKKLYINTYIERLSHKLMKPELMDIFWLKTDLWDIRSASIARNSSANWTSQNLQNVLSKLKNNKALDPLGMVNEVFKPGCIGPDLFTALLNLFNMCKSSQMIPTQLTLSNITSIHKNKGSRLLLENDRGIFLQPVLKKILDKMIYYDMFGDIDRKMSESNIGARKKRNIRDHLFIIYSVINSVIKDNMDCIDIQLYDIQKCFDSLWLDDVFNDLYDILPPSKRNDKISLLYNSCKTNLVAVKTPGGLSDRVNMPGIIQQGGVWGSLLCSNTIDYLGRVCRDTGQNIYLYKNRAEILPLGFVDDLNGIAKCGVDSLNMNIFFNTQVELKKLTFHTDANGGPSKCVRMHVGKRAHPCYPLRVHDQKMTEATEITYLGDVICSDGRNLKNVHNRTRKGIGLMCQIIKMIHTISLGSYTVEIFLLLRNSLFINGMLTNAEVWFDLKKSELEQIDKTDRTLLQKVFQMSSTTPAVSLYLELGILPLSILIKVRRVIYLHNILSSKRDGMLFKVFTVQWHFPSKGDWVLQVKTDLEDFELPSDLETIRNFSKTRFKNVVKSKARTYTFNMLSSRKGNYSKLERLQYTELKTQNYLLDTRITHDDKIALLKLRTRMADFGENFRAGRLFIMCPLCNNHLDSQSFLLQCPELLGELQSKFGPKYSRSIDEVFSNDIGLDTINLIKYALDLRNSKIKE